MLNQLFYAVILFQTENPKVTGDVGSGLLYLTVAFVVIWLMIFGYIYSLNRRQERLRRDIQELQQSESQAEVSQDEIGSSSQLRG